MICRNFRFDSVNDKLSQETKRIGDEQKTAQRQQDVSYAKSMTLRLARNEELRAEFTTLNHEVRSATIFFKAKDVGNDDEVEETFLEDF